MNSESGSLARIRIGRKTVDVVPFWGVIYGAFIVLTLIGVTIATEKRVFPRLERERMLPSERWEHETSVINANNRGKILTDDPVWKSSGFPVTVERKKSHRILVMGDSFAWAAALDNMNDVWWRQLQRELERRGYDDVEVIAACASGASTRMELGYAREVVPRYKPDLIVWGYVTNDPDEGMIPQMDPARADIKIADHRLHRILDFISPEFPLLAYRINYLRSGKRQVLASDPKNGYEYAEWELALLRGENFRRYATTLREVAAFHAQTGVPGFFITLPNFPSTGIFAPRYAAVKPLFRAAGIRFFDLLPDFVGRYGGSAPLRFAATPNDGHPGPVSTHFFAVECADILERDYRHILGRRSVRKTVRPHVNDWAPFDLKPSALDGTVAFDYPKVPDSMLQMPDGEAFVQLNLAEAVPLARVTVEGAYLDRVVLSWTEIDADAGYDRRAVNRVPERRGRSVAFALPAGRAINTIRIRADFVPEDKMPKQVSEEPLPGPYSHEIGHCWLASIPHLENIADNADVGIRSWLQLLENGVPIGAAHSQHVDVRTKGGGLFSHWKTMLYFSTTDNSDPNTNGRKYSIRLVKVPDDARRVRVTFVPSGGR